MTRPRGVLGFTGTSRHALRPRQLKVLRQLLWYVNALHLGDCVHADVEAYMEAVALGVKTIGHPPSDSLRRAYCAYDEERAPLPFLVRNHAIVYESIDGLIAAPSRWVEEQRSGTWATVRYARKLKRRIWIVLPDGRVKEE